MLSGRLKRRTPRLTKNNSTSTLGMSPIYNGTLTDREEGEQEGGEQGEEDEPNIGGEDMRSPTPTNGEEVIGMVGSPQRTTTTDSAGNSQSQQMNSPPGTRAARKKGKEVEGNGTGGPGGGGRSPRKRRGSTCGTAETRQRLGSGEEEGKREGVGKPDPDEIPDFENFHI